MAREVFARPMALAVIGPFEEDAFGELPAAPGPGVGEPPAQELGVAAHSGEGPP